MTVAAAASIAAGPRRPALDRPVAMRLAAQEYERFVEQVRSLAPTDWRRPTACSEWDVHAVVCHLLGSMQSAASPVEAIRQARAARAVGGPFVDALSGVQVAKHRHRDPADLLARLERAAPRAARGRRRTPSFVRHRPMPVQGPVDPRSEQTEPWTIGYLLDVVLTRDTWMHRSDIAAATGRPMRLTADHDGVLVADIAAEWAARHGRPCTLTLTGPAGGSWTWGDGGPTLEVDAVEFCRAVSGRGAPDGLLATPVPF